MDISPIGRQLALQQLKRLAEAVQSGILTPEEYERNRVKKLTDVGLMQDGEIAVLNASPVGQEMALTQIRWLMDAASAGYLSDEELSVARRVVLSEVGLF